MKKLFTIISVLMLWGCSPHSLNDFQREAEGQCKALVLELQKAQTREDLVKSEPKLRRLFDQLATLIIAAQKYQQQHLDEAPMLSNAYEEPLLEEMMRLYRIEGGREIIERAQREALIRIDSNINSH